MILNIMETREAEDFDLIIKLLNLTMRWNADVENDPYANHKLRWTLRVVSGLDLSEKNGPLTEAVKEDALKKGIERINRFGMGTGYFDGNGKGQNSNTVFLEKFNALLINYKVVFQ